MIRLLLMAALATGTAASAQESVRFVACPIYRDTNAGRKSGCWLVDEPVSGRRYDATSAPSKPDWNHEVLVEGIVARDAADTCGGIVLDPVRTSILPGSCPRHKLPAEGYRGRVFALPARSVQPLNVPRKPLPGPFTTKRFAVFFDFDSDFVPYQYGDWIIDQTAHYIRSSTPRRIVVTGYAATGKSAVSGRTLSESPAIAKARAEKLAEALARLGASRDVLVVRWKRDAQPVDDPNADGLAEASRRRAEIEVIP